MTLQQIFEKHGTDKAQHFYHAVYEKLTPPNRLLEVGVWKGASLRAWCEWWPDAEITGVDIGARGIVQRVDRAVVLQWDSTKGGGLPSVTFDLIIDDASHRPRDQAKTFTNLWPLLTPGGVYFIEDCFPIDLFQDEDFPAWFDARREHFNMATWLDLANAIAASGGTLTRHDFRAQSGKPDSVLLQINKP